jgi:hypothetical protein
VDGNMTTHFTYPQDYIFITNSKGEVKIYFPSQNQVMLQHNDAFSSGNDVLYSFLTLQTNDLGLKESGFSIQNTRYEENLMITTWLPPLSLVNQISKIEMAHENYMPIYTAIYNTKSKFSKKIYYSNYTTVGQFSLPLKMTEIEYLANGDSIVSRKEYSDFKLGSIANSAYFNYPIPANAKLMKLPEGLKEN